MKKAEVKLTGAQKKLKEQLEYGDITNIANALGISRMTIWNTLNGKRQAPYLWVFIEKLIEDRHSKRIDKITKLNA